MIFAGSGSDKVYHSRPKRQLIQFSFCVGQLFGSVNYYGCES